MTQIHLINLDRTPDRLARFHETNNHLDDVVRFPAFDGSSPDIANLAPSGTIAPDLNYLPGAIGCALSHIALWREVIDAGREMTIAEDDALFSLSFESQRARLLKDLPPDWDFIAWGYEFKTFLWVELLPGISVAEIRPNFHLLHQNIAEFSKLDSKHAA